MLEELDHSLSMLEELNHFAHDLLWTWEPRIEAAFRVLDPERWEATRQNPVMLLSQLGEVGVAKALESAEARAALDEARAAYRDYTTTGTRPS